MDFCYDATRISEPFVLKCSVRISQKILVALQNIDLMIMIIVFDHHDHHH